MGFTPITVFAKWQIKEEHFQTVLDLLPELVQKTQQEEGNLFYKIYQSQSNTHTIILYEGYVDENALDFHRSSEHFKNIALKQIIPLLEKREVELTTELF